MLILIFIPGRNSRFKGKIYLKNMYTILDGEFFTLEVVTAPDDPWRPLE